MSDIDDLTEDDIPDLSDEELERVVAEWLGWNESPSGRWEAPRYPNSKSAWRADPPHYTSDPAAAWRLQRRMPAELVWQYDKTVLKCNLYHPNDDCFWVEGSQGMDRILAEAAAIIAVLGVEPREVE